METKCIHVCKSPPLVPVLSQTNPVHASPSHFLKIHFNIVLHSMSRSFNWSPSLRSPHQNCACTSYFSHTCHMPSSSHSLDLIISIIFGEEYRSYSSSSCSPLHSPVNLIHVRPKYLSQHPILKHPWPMFILQCKRPSFTHI
jgi:hypothetical protein